MKQKNIKDAANKYADSIAQDEHKKEYCIVDFEEGAKWMMNNIKNEWNNVKDILPDMQSDVIVSDGYTYWFSHRTDDKSVITDNNSFTKIADLEIKYWMSIPPLKKHYKINKIQK